LTGILPVGVSEDTDKHNGKNARPHSRFRNSDVRGIEKIEQQGRKKAYGGKRDDPVKKIPGRECIHTQNNYQQQ
jgi:hypothetical protein